MRIKELERKGKSGGERNGGDQDPPADGPSQRGQCQVWKDQGREGTSGGIVPRLLLKSLLK
jgi:hypothetical protein